MFTLISKVVILIICNNWRLNVWITVEKNCDSAWKDGKQQENYQIYFRMLSENRTKLANTAYEK